MAARRSGRRRGRAWLLLLGVIALVALGAGWYSVHQAMPGWYARLWYPLEHEDAINREAARRNLDPALVAAVVWRESDFHEGSRSGPGAVGLMQLLPSTARFIASQPGHPAADPARLEDPDVNIAYGAWYLRYLLDRHGSLPLALAAYNGGTANVSRWVREAQARGAAFRAPDDVPFPETRRFVRDVQRARSIYRRSYGDRLAPAP